MNYDVIRIGLEKEISESLYSLLHGDILKKIMKEEQVEGGTNQNQAWLESNGFRITDNMSPKLYKLCHDAKNALKFENPIDFYIISDPSLNCFAIQKLKDEEHDLVAIHSGLLEKFDTDELKFVIGHEIGHLISRNIELMSIAQMVFLESEHKNYPIIMSNKIALWTRLSELSADRYGLIACNNMSKCISAFFKMASGIDTSRIDFNPETYMEEIDNSLQFLIENKSYQGTSHPVNPIRTKALKFFSESELFRCVMEGGKIKIDNALEDKTDELLQIMLTIGVTEMDEHRKGFIASGGIMMATIDGEMSIGEVEKILMALAGFNIKFPLKYFSEICEIDQEEITKLFNDSVNYILERNPFERYDMFNFLMDIVICDRSINENEVEFLFNIGTNVFGLARKEIAQAFGAIIRASFRPNFIQ